VHQGRAAVVDRGRAAAGSLGQLVQVGGAARCATFLPFLMMAIVVGREGVTSRIAVSSVGLRACRFEPFSGGGPMIVGERDEWQRRLREQVEGSVRRRAARAAVRQDLARRRRRGMDARVAAKLMRADLDAACADTDVSRDG
jgi:hypothetical protein